MSANASGGDGDNEVPGSPEAKSPGRQRKLKRAPSANETEDAVPAKAARAGQAPTAAQLIEEGVLPEGLGGQYGIYMGFAPADVRTMLQDACLPVGGEKHRQVLRLVRMLGGLPPTEEDRELVEEHEAKKARKAGPGKPGDGKGAERAGARVSRGASDPKEPKQPRPKRQPTPKQPKPEQPGEEVQEVRAAEAPATPKPAKPAVPPKEVIESFLRELVQTADLATMTLRRVFAEIQEKYGISELVEPLQKKIRSMVLREIELKRQRDAGGAPQE